MKRIFSVVLAALLAASALASCAAPAPAPAASSSATQADEAWLEARLGKLPENVTVGLASDLGIDMSSFENDGYLIRTTDGETAVCAKTADGLDRAVRAYAKAYEAGKTVPDSAYHEGYRIERLTVAGRDISEYTVTYEGGSSPSTPSTSGITVDNACFAAKDLARLVKIACGADLPVVPADPSVSPAIRIGYITDGSLGENGFAYEVKNGDIIINGAPEANGCGNAVAYLLETECGWASLTYGDAELAEADLVDIPEGTSASVDPMFDYVGLSGNYFDSFKNDRSAMTYRGKIANGSHGMQANKWGGWQVDVTGGQHPCFTDEGLRENICVDIIDYLNAKPKALTVDIGIGDNYVYCRCKNCLKVMREEDGALAGPIVRWANAIDDYVTEEFPDRELAFQILAYAGCNRPPVTAPRENIVVTFCNHGVCSNHYLDGSEGCEGLFDFLGVMESNRTYCNTDYADWMRGWCALSDNVYIWHYGLDCPFHQYTQTHNLYEDFHFIADCGIRGFLYEGETYGMGEGRLRLQELMMMQYHPDWTRAEYDAAVADLYAREFGDGGEYILAYTKNCWSPAQLAAGCNDCWGYTELIRPASFDHDTFRADEKTAADLLNAAIALADNEKQQKAAERFSCDYLYKVCYSNYFRALDAGNTATLAKLDETYALFRERMAHNGFTSSYRNLGGTWTFHDTLAEEAEINWADWRDELTDPETLIPITDEVIDGKNVYYVTRVDSLDKIDWLKIPAASVDLYKWVECTEHKTIAQLVYVEDYGFVCRMTCYESDPVARYTKMDDTVCFDSCMEFFVNFDGKKYLNLEGNSIATVCMQSGSSRNSRSAVNRKLPGGFKTTAEVKSDRWYLTYYLPIDEIKLFAPDVTADTFISGYTFSGNFYKTAGTQTKNEHYAMWNEVMTDNPDFHQPKYFGTFIME